MSRTPIADASEPVAEVLSCGSDEMGGPYMDVLPLGEPMPAGTKLYAAPPAPSEEALREALEWVKGEVEMAAAYRAYQAGLGAGEWESFLQTWETQVIERIDRALAPPPEPRP